MDLTNTDASRAAAHIAAGVAIDAFEAILNSDNPRLEDLIDTGSKAIAAIAATGQDVTEGVKLIVDASMESVLLLAFTDLARVLDIPAEALMELAMRGRQERIAAGGEKAAA